MDTSVKGLLVVVIISLVLTCGQSLCPLNCRCQNQDVTCTQLVNEFPGVPKSTVRLIIQDSYIDDITRDVFEGLGELKEFLISSSSIRYIHTCSISNLQNMTSLKFESVTIDQIIRNGFSHFTNIKEISIKGSTINNIQEFAFHDITNNELFQITDSSIGNLGTSAFRDIINVKNFVLRNLTIGNMDHAPIQAVSGINNMKITGNVFRSVVCGLESAGNISVANTIRILNFSRNSLPCNNDFVDSISAFEGSKTSIIEENNICTEPTSVQGKVLDKDTRRLLLNDDDGPACPSIKNMKDEHSCQKYTLDDPILAGDEVPYPENPNTVNRGQWNCPDITMVLQIFLVLALLRSFAII